MNQFLLDLWQSIYYTAAGILSFILWQAWLALGLLLLLVAAKILEWKVKMKKGQQEKE